MSEGSTSKTNFLLGFFIGMAVVSVIGFFVLLIVVFSNGQPVDLAAKAQAIDEQVVDDGAGVYNEVPPVTNEDYFEGGENASVVVIEYTDFECPYCYRHYETTKQLVEAYGDKIKLVVRHYPLPFHANAQKASEAAECAGEQGKFWQMYDALFAANNAKDMSVDKWKATAKTLGMNTANFNDCLDSGKYADYIQQVAAAGAGAGVEGTPATFINGNFVSGAVPFDSLKEAIDALLQ
ncbi:DsbA family protein [Patescibacteria group bacterium]|nr:DsbA family protein [Patescibacteria group bacterium]